MPPVSSSPANRAQRLSRLEHDIRACRICRDAPHGRPLPHEPRPVLQVSAKARLALCGQAPGIRVHASGQPFTDPSGDRLRSWTGLEPEVFYDPARVAIVPMGFCFPGLDAKGSDLPPRRECAATWHRKVFDAMPQVELVLLIGGYAIAWHLETTRPVAEAVADWHAALARPGPRRYLPLPHPSWRNSGWLKRNPWFEAELVPVLRAEVARCVAR